MAGNGPPTDPRTETTPNDESEGASVPTRGTDAVEFMVLDSDFGEEAFLPEVDSDPPPPPPAQTLTRSEPNRERPSFELQRSNSSKADVVSVSELLESGVAVDWPEAVAIARRLCAAIARHPSAGAQEYRLDPQRIEITDRGEVLVTFGAAGGDPAVKQVGRVLRALLESSPAPAPLRLLASQASFDMSGFATVEDLSEALCRFEATSETEAIRAAFNRSREARYSSVPAPEPAPVRAPATSPAVEPLNPQWDDRLAAIKTRPTPRPMLVGGLVVALLMVLAFEATRRISGGVVLTDRSAAARDVQAEAQRANDVVTAAPKPDPPAPAPKEVALPLSQTSIRQDASSAAPQRDAPRLQIVREPEPRILATPGAPASSDRRESLQRTYDALVLSDPLYRLEPGLATPEAVVALRDSKRTLLPSMARREYDAAKAALEMKDYERAQQAGERAGRIMDDPDVGAIPPSLRESVRQLLGKVREERAVENNHVYSETDAGVEPPAALGRQLPLAPPAGLSKQLVGQLEIVVGLDGLVEAVKLHTPLNRYHERMIVSAAKAWRYRPAMKEGRPVRFRLFSAVNLPEN